MFFPEKSSIYEISELQSLSVWSLEWYQNVPKGPIAAANSGKNLRGELQVLHQWIYTFRNCYSPLLLPHANIANCSCSLCGWHDDDMMITGWQDCPWAFVRMNEPKQS
jgi:hypothetical protein